LVENNYNEIAALAVDTHIELIIGWEMDPDGDYHQDCDSIAFLVPTSSYALVKYDDLIKRLMERAMKAVSQGIYSCLFSTLYRRDLPGKQLYPRSRYEIDSTLLRRVSNRFTEHREAPWM
jgi:hypothetical protein